MCALCIFDSGVNIRNRCLDITDFFPGGADVGFRFCVSVIKSGEGIDALFFKKIIGGGELLGISYCSTFSCVRTLYKQEIIAGVLDKSKLLIILPYADIRGLFYLRKCYAGFILDPQIRLMKILSAFWKDMHI